MNFKIYTIILFLFFTTEIKTHANIKIKYKINDQIITNVDILNEVKYLSFLRPSLKNLKKNEIIQISENSLIRETIKKKELNKIFKNLNDDDLLRNIKGNLIKFTKVKNEDELKNILKKEDIDYVKILEKMKYEAMWNQLIYKKYNSLVKIDETILKEKLIKKLSSKKKYEYNLSELLFEVESEENFKNKYAEILEFIKLNNFKSAILKFSISKSASNEGEIGWIKETLLSEEINLELKKTNIKSFTKPFKSPNGYLILRINQRKEMQTNYNLEKELKDLVRFEKNKQLNQFSLLFFKKLKQNTNIDEF